MEKKTGNMRMDAAAWKRELRRLFWLLLLPLAVLLPRLAGRYPLVVERIFGQGLYPVISFIVRTIFGIVPFSVAEWLLYALVIGVPALVISMLIRAALKRTTWLRFTRFLITLLIIGCVAFNGFYFLWGFNYFRPGLSWRLELDVHDRPVEELKGLCYALSSEANALREQAPEDERGVFILPNGVRESFDEIPEAYRALHETLPQIGANAARPKTVLLSTGLSWAGISGIFIPFTGEANVNIDQPALLIPSSAAHESAHSLGIAREDEANFIAYLACTASDDIATQYSGVMLALIHSGNQLHKADPDAYLELRGTYGEKMRRDLAEYDAYWTAFEGPVEETVTRVNDGYLKYNQQESGVRSYGEMVDLLLAYFEQRNR
ncbi:MAG TPA: DUF3810 domain-containing protein [Feifaniaceae bacterium]|nr:DUF3810 domain-containing protein [Feifaniaceae bacterium]